MEDREKMNETPDQTIVSSPTTGVVHPAGYGAPVGYGAPDPALQSPYAASQYGQRPMVDPPDPENMRNVPPHAAQAYASASYAQERPYAPPPYSGQTPYGQQPYTQIPPGPSPKGRSGLFGIGRKNAAALVVVIIVACAASGVGGGLIGANLYGSANTGGDVVSGGSSGVTINPSGDITTTEAVAKKVTSSVVGITSTGSYTSDNFFFGPTEEEVTGVGTGMILDTQGYILTNSHVVMDGAVDTIKVLMSDGSEVDGSVIWSDASLDLAIVKIEAEGLVPVELGDSDEVAMGSYVAAIGNPLGLEFSGSITQGVVSGLNRTIQVSDGMGGSQISMQGLIQVDAAINSGNSGGPLLNSKGQVIGINTAKASAEGMGFAIPINTAIPIVEKVIKDGHFERVYIGVSATDVSVVRDNYSNVELFVDEGACITDVSPGSPAEKGGLKVKDVITAIDGNAVNGSDALIKLLLGYGSGETINVTYDRNGETLETDVTLLSQSELEQAQQNENPFIEPQRGNGGR